MSEEHVHQWKHVLHLDGCHFYSSTYSCECGASLGTWAERKMRGDSMGMLWALPDCERCQELLDGARRKPARNKIVEPV